MDITAREYYEALDRAYMEGLSDGFSLATAPAQDEEV